MTRVERINAAIKYMFIEEGLQLKDIKKKLMLYHIELDMDELISIVAVFDYKPVKHRKLSILQERRVQFKPILDRFVKIASEESISNRQLFQVFNHYGMKYPCKGEFTKENVDTIIASYNIKYPRACYGFKSKYNSIEEVLKVVASKLDSSTLEAIKKWNETNV